MISRSPPAIFSGNWSTSNSKSLPVVKSWKKLAGPKPASTSICRSSWTWSSSSLIPAAKTRCNTTNYSTPVTYPNAVFSSGFVSACSRCVQSLFTTDVHDLVDVIIRQTIITFKSVQTVFSSTIVKIERFWWELKYEDIKSNEYDNLLQLRIGMQSYIDIITGIKFIWDYDKKHQIKSPFGICNLQTIGYSILKLFALIF